MPGSTGQNQSPGHVFKGKRMPGHLGDVRRTILNLEVVRIDAERQLLLVKGSVPGSEGRDVVVRPAIEGPASTVVKQQPKARRPSRSRKAAAKPARSPPPSRAGEELRPHGTEDHQRQGRAPAPSPRRTTCSARDFNEALVHQIVVAFQANARIGTRAQKDRGEVATRPRSRGARRAPAARAPA